MKKAVLLFILTLGFKAGYSQFELTGNTYTQDFNSLASLPAGWYIYTGASATAVGMEMSSSKYYPGKTHTWEKYFGEFREVASANNSPYFAGFDSTKQSQATDRALAVRQVSNGNYDPGAAFVLKFTNPYGLTDFKLSFQLQSLDSLSPRETEWTIDYGVGGAPTTFTPVTATGNMATGGNTYSNKTINVDFGTALNNKFEPVWIRIVALKATQGGGNRPTTAIDDFKLTWTGTPKLSIENVNANNMPLLASATANSTILSFAAAATGTYNATIVDLNGRVVNATAIQVTATGEQKYTINNLSLVPGMYIVKLAGENFAGTTKVVVQ